MKFNKELPIISRTEEPVEKPETPIDSLNNLLQAYKSTEKQLSTQIEQLEKAIQGYSQNRQNAIAQLNAVIGGIDALNTAINKLSKEK